MYVSNVVDVKFCLLKYSKYFFLLDVYLKSILFCTSFLHKKVIPVHGASKKVLSCENIMSAKLKFSQYYACIKIIVLHRVVQLVQGAHK